MGFKYTYQLLAQLILLVSFETSATIALPKKSFVNVKTERKVDLAFFRGLPTFVTFFQPGCSACEKQLKEFECFERKHAGRFNLIMMGTFAKKPALKKYVMEKKFIYPAFYSSPDYLKSIGGIKYTPLTLAVNHQGKLVKRLEGTVSCSKLDQLYPKMSH